MLYINCVYLLLYNVIYKFCLFVVICFFFYDKEMKILFYIIVYKNISVVNIILIVVVF